MYFNGLKIWGMDDIPTDIPTGVYGISFSENEHSSCMGGEVFFFVDDGDELREKWEEYCEDCGHDYYVDNVWLDQDEFHILEEFLERTGAVIYKDCTVWHIDEMGDDRALGTKSEMMRYMVEQNDDMRA